MLNLCSSFATVNLIGMHKLTLSILCLGILFNIVPKTYPAPPQGFQTTQIIGIGLTSPTGFDTAPDGRIFILQQNGVDRIYKNTQLLPTPFTPPPPSGGRNSGNKSTN